MIKKFYGEDAKHSDSYGRLVNVRHFRRVKEMIDPSKVVFGGESVNPLKFPVDMLKHCFLLDQNLIKIEQLLKSQAKLVRQ